MESELNMPIFKDMLFILFFIDMFTSVNTESSKNILIPFRNWQNLELKSKNICLNKFVKSWNFWNLDALVSYNSFHTLNLIFH